MFNKKVLSMAVACAATGISVGALAAFDVTDGGGEIAIASESVTPTTTGVLQVGVTNTTGALDVTGDILVGVPANDQIYIRYDWTGGELLADLPQTAVTVGTTGSTSLTGGLDGATSAVFGVLAGAAGFNQTAAVTLAFGSNGIGLAGTTLDVRQRVYTDQGNAIAGATALSDQTASGVISIQDALSVSFDPATATADVETSFKEFVSTGDTLTGVLGTFSADFQTGLSLATDLSTVTALSDLVNTGTVSTVTYTGNFGFNTTSGFYVSGATDGSCTAGGSTPLTPDTVSYTSASTTVAIANNAALCATVDGSTETIPEVSSFDAAVTLVHANTSSSPSSTTDSGSVGSIDRNGTTVEVAYVTTFADYNQRLILNSRSSTSADYFVTFQTEDGVTSSALPAATGTLAPGEVVILKMTDLVTFTGGSRGAATVTVVAPDTDIDVATTQVLKADGATDTVYWSVK